MVNGIVFFTYIFAGLVGFLAIMLAVIVARHRSSGNKGLLSTIRNFMICTMLIDAIYFYIEYRVLATGEYYANPFIRVMDIGAFIGQAYFWCAYIREKSRIAQGGQTAMRRFSLTITLTCLMLSIVTYGFLMDDYYLVQPGPARAAALLTELFLCLSLTLMTIWHLVQGLNEILQKQSRIYITAISILMTPNGIWNSILILLIMTGKYSLEEEKGVNLDPTALLIFLVNLFTVLLVYKEDFSALFQAPEDASLDDLNKKLDFLAVTHSLTEREREVVELAYEGLTNPQIGEVLIISKYTVKRHMHNIFEKLDISTRMELIHLVDHQNGPPGPLKKNRN